MEKENAPSAQASGVVVVVSPFPIIIPVVLAWSWLKPLCDQRSSSGTLRWMYAGVIVSTASLAAVAVW